MTPSITEPLRAMLDAHPMAASITNLDALTACLTGCFECEQICGSCADACLGETEHLAHLVHCIRLNLDCADICAATGRALLRLTQPDVAVLRAQLQACLAACGACAAECESHASMGMTHCELCAASCRRCEAACRSLLGTMN